jgi:hypothetical protein
MAKIPVTYVGTHDDPTSEITFGNLSFEKGKVQQVDEDAPEMAKLRNNPTFEVGSGATSAAREARAEVKAQQAAE